MTERVKKKKAKDVTTCNGNNEKIFFLNILYTVSQVERKKAGTEKDKKKKPITNLLKGVLDKTITK